MRYRRITALLAVSLALLSLSAVMSESRIASASSGIPVLGTFTGTTNVTPCGGGDLCLTATDSGRARGLGRATLATSITIQFLPAPCALPDGTTGGASTFSGTTVITGANGDTLTLNEVGTSCHGASGGTAEATFAVSAGTGRFSDATGTGTLTALGNAVGGETVTVSGTISLR